MRDRRVQLDRRPDANDEQLRKWSSPRIGRDPSGHLGLQPQLFGLRTVLFLQPLGEARALEL